MDGSLGMEQGLSGLPVKDFENIMDKDNSIGNNHARH